MLGHAINQPLGRAINQALYGDDGDDSTPLFQLNNQATIHPEVGSSGSYSANAVRTFHDVHGTIRQAVANQARFEGGVVVENAMTSASQGTALSSAWFTLINATRTEGRADPEGGTDATLLTATTANGYTGGANTGIAAGDNATFSIWLRRVTGTGAIQLWDGRDGGNRSTITGVTSEWKRFTPGNFDVTASPFVGVFLATSGDEVEYFGAQHEDKTGNPDKNPSPYVSVGVLSSPYHGLGVDGKKLLTNSAGQPVFNGNSVSGNVVTERTGPVITDSNCHFSCHLNNGDRAELAAVSAIETAKVIDFKWRGVISDYTVNNQVISCVDDGGADRKFNIIMYSAGAFRFDGWDTGGSARLGVQYNVSYDDYFPAGALGNLRFIAEPTSGTNRLRIQISYRFDVDVNDIPDSDWETLLDDDCHSTGYTLGDFNDKIQLMGRATSSLYVVGRMYQCTIAVTEGGSPAASYDANALGSWSLVGNAYVPDLKVDASGPYGARYDDAGVNDLTYSSDLTNGAYTQTNITVDSAVAVVNGISMDRVNVDANANTHLVRRTSNQTVSTATDYSFTGYLLDDGSEFVQVFIYGGATDWAAITINAKTGTITDTGTGAGTMSLTSSAILREADGQVRFRITVQDSANTTMLCHVAGVDSATPSYDASAGNVSYTPSDGDDFLAGGFMFHPGAQFLPYAKTEGTAYSGIFSDNEYTFVDTEMPITIALDINPEATGVQERILVLSDGEATTDRILIMKQSTNVVKAFLVNNNLVTAEITLFTADGQMRRVVFAVGEDDAEAWVDGSSVGTDISTGGDFVNGGLNKLQLASGVFNAEPYAGNIRKFVMKNERVTNPLEMAA